MGDRVVFRVLLATFLLAGNAQQQWTPAPPPDRQGVTATPPDVPKGPDQSDAQPPIGKKKKPPTPAAYPRSPAGGERVYWNENIEIRYGATFDFRSSDPYTYSSEEIYQFISSDPPSPIKVLGYCEEKVPFHATDKIDSFCPLQPPPGPKLKLSKRASLSDTDYVAHGFLQEEFVLSARPIWLLLQGSDGTKKWRFLNYFQGMRDLSGGNSRITTLRMPSHTFVSLEAAHKEGSAEGDVCYYPRQFLFETLVPRTTAVSRLNPRLPHFLFWSAQRLLEIGVTNVVWQWVLLVLVPILPVGWLYLRLRRRKIHS